VAKVATSEGPSGTVAGVQFAGFVQLLSAGLAFHVALPARAQIGRKPEQASKTAGRKAKVFTRPLYR